MKTEAQRLSELPHMELVTMLCTSAVYKPDLYLAASYRIIELEHKLRLTQQLLAASKQDQYDAFGG